MRIYNLRHCDLFHLRSSSQHGSIANCRNRTRGENMAQSKSRNGNGRASAGKPRIVLLLQGGGALGAYHIGAYQAMQEAGYEPDWVSGISIGAINAAVIA